MAAAVIVVISKIDKEIELKFAFDITNLKSPGDTLRVKPKKKAYLVFRPQQLGERIGLGLTINYKVLE